MSTILFPTDFSITANNAFLYALNLAKVFNADIRLITLKTHLNESLNMQEEEFNDKVNQLKLLASDYDLGDIKIRASLEFGDLLLTILDIIKAEKIRYVVMGTNGENNFDKKVFGSFTLSVINNVSVPVVAIPNHVKYKKERKFAYATLFDKKEDKAVEEMIAITKAHHTRLNAVHIEDKTPTVDERIDRQEWESKFPEVDVEIVKSEFIEDALVNYCQVNKIDVLGIVHRDLNFFQRLFSKNYSKELLTNADCAIVVLKGDKE